MSEGATARRKLPWPAPRFSTLAGPILVAVAADFALNIALEPPQGRVALAARIASFGVLTGLAILAGLWLGRRTWPRRGRVLTLRLLARVARRPLVLVTDRPDESGSLMRRTLEVIGFAAGVPVLAIAILALLGVSAGIVVYPISILALWGSFVFVPYWLYARMGLREVDAVRWVITPLSRRYADRLKLSNGALLLFAAGAVVNLAFRAGASGDVALVTSIIQVGHVVAFVLVIAATAVASYMREEQALAREMEAKALTLGLRDARGMTDGQFLPRIQPPQ